MIQILSYIQILLSVLLVTGVLLQRSEASLGAAFGGDSAMGSRFMRRGLEKLIFNTTIIIATLFCLAAFASLFLYR